MSHSVTITVENTKESINTCDKNIDKINIILKSGEWTTKTKEKWQEKIVELNEIKKEIQNLEGTYLDDNILKLSSLSKSIVNEMSNIDFLKELGNFYKEKESEIHDCIQSLGIIGIETLHKIREEQGNITKENIQKVADELRLAKIDEKKLNEYKKITRNLIIKSIFNDDIKFEFMNLLNKYNTLQELNDFNAVIEEKKEEEKRIQSIKMVIEKSLKSEKFICLKNSKFTISENHTIKAVFKWKNSEDKIMDVIIYGDGRISYKLGNYVGHACEKTSNNLFKTLESHGYVIKHRDIRRDVDNSRILRASEMKERME